MKAERRRAGRRIRRARRGLGSGRLLDMSAAFVSAAEAVATMGAALIAFGLGVQRGAGVLDERAPNRENGSER